MAKVAATTSSIEKRYEQSAPRSGQLFERAATSLPGGNTRTTIFVEPYPYYFDHGIGSRIYDVDGNERIDFVNNYTALILGHAHPAVIDAVERQLRRGTSAAAPTELEIQLAEVIKSRLPSLDHVRFTNSGTEATMHAIRAARAFTGREKIAKFEGSYHGTHDYAAVDVSAAGAVGSGTQATSAGIPAAVASTVVIMPLNDRDAVERMVAQHREDLAAIIIEPVLGSGGILVPEPGFLQFLRDITRRSEILLIFDEVIAFRIGYDGAQGRFGVTPDLTTLGKIIGGGFPIGAFGGRGDVMALFDPRRPNHIGHGGTFNAHPIAMAGGLATLQEMTPDVYERLDELGADLKSKLLALFSSLGQPAQVNQVGSLFNIHFAEGPIADYPAVLASDRQLVRDLSMAALNHGIALTGRGMGCLSTPMTVSEIDAFVEATRRSLADLGRS
jgi:glutamate-1-semialdehyde 2,1-aminomutase